MVQQNQRQILVRSPNGTALGTITFPEAPANCTFGGKDMKTLYVTARTSVYVCRMDATGHRFAWNPASYADFQRKFFGTTNAPNAARGDDPDADGVHNELEYLIRSHPIYPDAFWRLVLERVDGSARITFPQIAGRGFEVQSSGALAPVSWAPLDVPGNPLPISTTNRLSSVDDALDPGTNRFYRVRVFEP